MASSINSLTRFFNRQNKTYPCWVAGRFYLNKEGQFELKSQGLSLKCDLDKKLLHKKQKQGDWLAVQINPLEGDLFSVLDFKWLSSCESDVPPSLEKVFVSKEWDGFLQSVRSFFKNEGVASVETPSLVSCPGTEPHLIPFQTEMQFNQSKKNYFLATSPEMHLKKLLCQDWTDFFEIKKCFRNGELSSSHEPEFYMLEWYRAFFSLDELIEDSFRLIKFLIHQPFVQKPTPEFKVYSMKDLFSKFLNFSLTPQTTREELLHLAQKEELVFSSESDWEDLFHLIFLNCIETKWDPKEVKAVKDYPPRLRAFARINSQGWADRFELYWQGFEMGNAFYEVVCPEEQKKIFEEHLAQRKDQVPYDEELLKFMSQGMPPCSGMALGLDRLFLALTDKKSLGDLKLFPFFKS